MGRQAQRIRCLPIFQEKTGYRQGVVQNAKNNLEIKKKTGINFY